MNYKILISIIILLLFYGGCTSSTRLTKLWEDDEYVHGQIEKVIVVAIVKDSLVRRAAEYHIKKRLKAEGVEAVASLEVMPAQAKQSEEAFRKIFLEHEFDGILTVRSLGINTKVSSGYNYNYSPSVSFYGYYGMAYSYSYTSQYTVRDKVHKIEVNLYDTLDDKLIWAGMAESKNPDKLSDVILPLSRMLADELIGDNFFKRD